MDNKNIADYITINSTFILDNDIQLIFRNFPLSAFSLIKDDNIAELFQHKWYMHGLYDVVSLLGSRYVITGMTKKKIELVRYNEKVNK